MEITVDMRQFSTYRLSIVFGLIWIIGLTHMHGQNRQLLLRASDLGAKVTFYAIERLDKEHLLVRTTDRSVSPAVNSVYVISTSGEIVRRLWTDSLRTTIWENQLLQVQCTGKNVWVVDQSGAYRLNVERGDTTTYTHCPDSARPSLRLSAVNDSTAFISGLRTLYPPDGSLYAESAVQVWDDDGCTQLRSSRDFLSDGVPEIIAVNDVRDTVVSHSFNKASSWAPLRDFSGVPFDLDGLDKTRRCTIEGLWPMGSDWIVVIETLPSNKVYRLDRDMRTIAQDSLWSRYSAIAAAGFDGELVSVAMDSGVAVYDPATSRIQMYPNKMLLDGFNFSFFVFPLDVVTIDRKLFVLTFEGIITLDMPTTTVRESESKPRRTNHIVRSGTVVDVSEICGADDTSVIVSTLEGRTTNVPVEREEGRSYISSTLLQRGLSFILGRYASQIVMVTD